jgi:hypothetical protein
LQIIKRIIKSKRKVNFCWLPILTGTIKTKRKVGFFTNNNEHHQIKRERCVEDLIQRKCSNNNLDSAEKINYLSSDVQVVKMMLMVVIIFCVCWLPYHTYFIGKKSWNLFEKKMLGNLAVRHTNGGFCNGGITKTDFALSYFAFMKTPILFRI